MARQVLLANVALATIVVVFASSVSASLNNTCCEALSSTLKTKVSYPHSRVYNSSLLSYWSAQEETLAPDCIVSPTTAQDVSLAIKILTTDANRMGHYMNQTAGCRFAIRSGGHTAQAGSANIDNGVTLDLSALNSTTLSEDKSTVTIGPGQRWKDVYAVLDPFRLSVQGVRSGGVGVGGSILGGGLSYFATREGFACDNVVSFEIVLANGSIIEATANSHQDLWIALKGGSRNFGIVTSFVLNTFEQGDLWAGSITYPTLTVSQQLEAFSAFCSDPDFDVNAAILPSFAFSGSAGSFIITELVYTQPVVNPPAFQPFTEIKPQLASTLNITALGPYSIVQQSLSPYQLQQLTFATTFENDLGMLHTLFNLWNTSTTSVASVAGITWSISVQPLNAAVTSRATLKGGNSLGLPVHPPRGSLILVLLSATWNDGRDDNRVRRVADELLRDIIGAAKASGTFNRFIDLNHADEGQDPITGYGPEVKEQLRIVSRKYDPSGVFQTLVPGGFGLFE